MLSPNGLVRRRATYARQLALTSRCRDLLDEIDVRLLDHIVVSRTETVSMAARGLI